MTLQEAEAMTILRCNVGSVGLGLSLSENPDRDEAGICLEPMAEAMGIYSQFEQFVFRTASERTGQHDAPSEPGDLDLTIYSLRKWIRLALKGNPTVLTLLFAPPIQSDARGSQLRELAPSLLSREAGKAYLGYMQAQRQRLLGERGQMAVNRVELVKAHGYDTKYACHMLRLGFQGVELLTTGSLSFPLQDVTRQFLLRVRKGDVPLQEALTRAGELEAEVKDLIDHSHLPAKPDVEKVEKWMLRLYFRQWSATRTVEDTKEDTNVFAGGFLRKGE